jgi:hypothetical protein
VTIGVDDGLAAATARVGITVRDLAPTADAGADRQVNEGASASFTATATDAGATDTLTYGWRVLGSGEQVVATGTGKTFNYVPADNGMFTVELTVTDDDGGAAVDTAILTVADVAPSMTLSNLSANEGQALVITPTVTDPGSADTLTYQWTVTSNNGQSVPSATTKSLSFTPRDNGQYALVLTVTDDDGAATSVTRFVTVANVAPTVTIGGPGGFFAGDAWSPAITATGPGRDTITSWLVNWGDGTTQTVASVAGLSHVYAAGSWTFSVSPTDEDGTYATTKSLSVSNAPILSGGTLTITGTAGADTVAVNVTSSAVDVTQGLAPNAVVRSFPRSAVTALVVDGAGGNDTVSLTGSNAPASTLLGGDGNDCLTATADGSRGPAPTRAATRPRRARTSPTRVSKCSGRATAPHPPSRRPRSSTPPARRSN